MTVDEVIKAYIAIFPEEEKELGLLLSQVDDKQQLNNRKNFRGHITGAGIVLSPDRRRILLVRHKFLNMWLQPGGHWDAEDANPLATAYREVSEETGAQLLKQISPFDTMEIPIDIETHAIKARQERNELAHYHHDFRYVFVAASEALRKSLSVEIDGCIWAEFTDPRAANILSITAKLHRFKLAA